MTRADRERRDREVERMASNGTFDATFHYGTGADMAKLVLKLLAAERRKAVNAAAIRASEAFRAYDSDGHLSGCRAAVARAILGARDE